MMPRSFRIKTNTTRITLQEKDTALNNFVIPVLKCEYVSDDNEEDNRKVDFRFVCSPRLVDQWCQLRAAGGFDNDENFALYLLDQEATRQKSIESAIHLTNTEPEFSRNGFNNEALNIDSEPELEKKSDSDDESFEPNSKARKPRRTVRVRIKKIKKVDLPTAPKRKYNKKPKVETDKNVTTKRKYIKKPEGSPQEKASRKLAKEIQKERQKPFVNAYICMVCNTNCLTSGEMWKHLEEEHIEELIVENKCRFCELELEVEGVVKDNADVIVSHVMPHIAKAFKCTNCDSCYPNKLRLNDHDCSLATDTTDTVEELSVCLSEKCGYVWFVLDGDKVYECRTCQKRFRSTKRWVDVQAHIAKHKNMALFICPICGRSYKARISLSNHIKAIHEVGSRECEVCGEVICYTSMKKHMQKHQDELTPDGNRKFLCADCGKSFRLKPLLKKHQLIHLNLKPHACQYCDKTFRQKINRDQHQRLHTGEKNYQCVFCGKSFILRAAYTQHVRVHTGIKASDQTKLNIAYRLKKMETEKFIKELVASSTVDSQAEQRDAACTETQPRKKQIKVEDAADAIFNQTELKLSHGVKAFFTGL